MAEVLHKGRAAVYIGLAWLAALAVVSFRLWGGALYPAGWLPAWAAAAGQSLSGLFGVVFEKPGLLWGLFLWAVFYLAGRALVSRLLPERPPWPLCAAAGMVMMALASLALGSAGLFTRFWLVLAALAAGSFGLVDFLLSRQKARPENFVDSGLGRMELAALFSCVLILILTATSPTLFYDAVSYHLALPRQYLLAGSTRPFGWHPFSFFPSNAEMCFGLAMAGGGLPAAQVLSGGVSIVSLFMIRSAAVRFVSPESGRSVFLVSLYTLTFLLSGVMVTADPFVLLFCIGGLFCVCGAAESYKKNGLVGISGWLFCWSVPAGGAAGVKYTAWITGLGLQGLLLLWFLRKSGRPGARLVAAAAGLAALLLLPWPLRNFIACGNPVMPVPVPGFSGLPGPAWQALGRDAHSVSWTLSHVPAIIASPWVMVFSRWDVLAREWGAARFIGPLLWMGAPLLLVFRERPRLPVAMVFYAVAATLISLAFFRMTRFAYPGLGAMVILAGAGLHSFLDHAKINKAVRITAMLLLLSVGILSAAIFMKASANLTAGYRYPRLSGNIASYLAARAEQNSFETGTISMQLEADGILPADALVLLAGETRLCYFERRAVAPSFLSSNPLLILLGKESAQDSAADLARAGFTHVLVSLPELRRLEKKHHLLGLSAELEDKVREFGRGPWCAPLLEDEAGGAFLCELAGEHQD